MAEKAPVTDYQQRVYALLRQIPSGRVSTYAALSKVLSSSPRAVGGALRRNPFAAEVPCHRVISANGYIGGFLGEWHEAPSGINQTKKLELLKQEGVLFTEKGMLVEQSRFWDDFTL
ncbi:Methylated-DNA--protein-cysteine methyltransferase [Cercospora beticola]|uniref:Methylated-DNA--protein-cysteine methyltransferase n=1 Tax=Cercospora beticola TaxID=122368 RepID=A0A2G5IBJ9_CERBT|nr:Methylated-DNA--protein-cysteine methyltransferase [Cercospora beticola]PIB02149.1 Methylated-DNA--protein-cysteine methyltransferase [Cercospora beticola]WPA96139.1 hypothetical protein RHO25_000745 [Cercospora beticola]CAK1355572.1 unnamed protein product [Cercospora beticola]